MGRRSGPQRLLQHPTKCSCNNLQKYFATFCKNYLQKTHTGGADLSNIFDDICKIVKVPAHTGGADLSGFEYAGIDENIRPRPHGRGGFKF